jgi:hypothetical protein
MTLYEILLKEYQSKTLGSLDYLDDYLKTKNITMREAVLLMYVLEESKKETFKKMWDSLKTKWKNVSTSLKRDVKDIERKIQLAKSKGENPEIIDSLSAKLLRAKKRLENAKTTFTNTFKTLSKENAEKNKILRQNIKNHITTLKNTTDPLEREHLKQFIEKLKGETSAATRAGKIVGRYSKTKIGIAAAGSGLTAYAATKVYKNYMQKAARMCAGRVGEDKQNCIKNYKRMAKEAKEKLSK